jgi:hypothetical protein
VLETFVEVNYAEERHVVDYMVTYIVAFMMQLARWQEVSSACQAAGKKFVKWKKRRLVLPSQALHVSELLLATTITETKYLYTEQALDLLCD